MTSATWAATPAHARWTLAARGERRAPPMEARILDEFRAIVGAADLITEPEQLSTYECDALTVFRVLPLAVLLPTSTEEVQAIVRVCHRERIPFVARGSGTGLSGGAPPGASGIVIRLSRMNPLPAVGLPHQPVVAGPRP